MCFRGASTERVTPPFTGSAVVSTVYLKQAKSERRWLKPQKLNLWVLTLKAMRSKTVKNLLTMTKWTLCLFQSSQKLWWVCVCWWKFLSLTIKSPLSTVMLQRLSSIPLKLVCEFILLKAVIWTLPKLPEKPLWSGSNTRSFILCPEDELAVLMANST